MSSDRSGSNELHEAHSNSGYASCYRQDFPQFNLRAVFEAIVNAVAHRDYSIYGCKIRFYIFDDRLEIFSPGAPPHTLKVENLPLLQATRNELITSYSAVWIWYIITQNSDLPGRLFPGTKQSAGPPLPMLRNGEKELSRVLRSIYKDQSLISMALMSETSGE